MCAEDKTYAWLKGSVTVEAAFIVPWSVFLIVFLIYVSFLLSNRTVAFEDGYALALRGARQAMSGEQTEQYMNERIERQFGIKYFGLSQFQKTVAVTGNKTSVIANGVVSHPFGRVVTMPGNHWRFGVEVKAERMDPTKMTRQIRTAERVISEVINE